MDVPWFSLEITREAFPWVYERGNKPALLISTLEALAVLMALKLHHGDDPGRNTTSVALGIRGTGCTQLSCFKRGVQCTLSPPFALRELLTCRPFSVSSFSTGRGALSPLCVDVSGERALPSVFANLERAPRNVDLAGGSMLRDLPRTSRDDLVEYWEKDLKKRRRGAFRRRF